MQEKFPLKAQEIMNERFGCDNVIALATVDGTTPWVRGVNAYYEDRSFYVVTYALSNKMRQIGKNPAVAISGEWFSAVGEGENIGHPCREENLALRERLKLAFSTWYTMGHVNEDDPDTCILRIKLREGTLFAEGNRCDIEF